MNSELSQFARTRPERRGVTKRDFSIIPTFQGQKTQKAQKVQEEKIIETESDHQQMQVDWGDDSVSYSPTPSLPERSQVFSPSPSILRIKRTADINEIPRKKHKVDEENIERKTTENQEQIQPVQKKRKIIKGTSQRKRGKMLDLDIIISNLFECIDDYHEKTGINLPELEALKEEIELEFFKETNLLHEIDALRTGLTQATKKDSSIRKQILQRNGEMHALQIQNQELITERKKKIHQRRKIEHAHNLLVDVELLNLMKKEEGDGFSIPENVQMIVSDLRNTLDRVDSVKDLKDTLTNFKTLFETNAVNK